MKEKYEPVIPDETIPELIPSTFYRNGSKVYSRNYDGTLERFDVSQGYLTLSKV